MLEKSEAFVCSVEEASRKGTFYNNGICVTHEVNYMSCNGLGWERVDIYAKGPGMLMFM